MVACWGRDLFEAGDPVVALAEVSLLEPLPDRILGMPAVEVSVRKVNGILRLHAFLVQRRTRKGSARGRIRV
jgi:hypothetical protein